MEALNIFIKAIQKQASAKANYQEYIASAEWAVKVAGIKSRRGNRCQLCGISGHVAILDAHHNTYERLGDELDRDIVILCRDCHGVFHKNRQLFGKEKISESKFIEILARHGITEYSHNPDYYYAKGKGIINAIIDGYNEELYDYYNKININIFYSALDNARNRRE